MVAFRDMIKDGGWMGIGMRKVSELNSDRCFLEQWQWQGVVGLPFSKIKWFENPHTKADILWYIFLVVLSNLLDFPVHCTYWYINWSKTVCSYTKFWETELSSVTLSFGEWHLCGQQNDASLKTECIKPWSKFNDNCLKSFTYWKCQWETMMEAWNASRSMVQSPMSIINKTIHPGNLIENNKIDHRITWWVVTVYNFQKNPPEETQPNLVLYWN